MVSWVKLSQIGSYEQGFMVARYVAGRLSTGQPRSDFDIDMFSSFFLYERPDASLNIRISIYGFLLKFDLRWIWPHVLANKLLLTGPGPAEKPDHRGESQNLGLQGPFFTRICTLLLRNAWNM